MWVGRKRKLVERQPNGQPRRITSDLRQKMRNASILPMLASARICAIYIICPALQPRPVKIGISVEPAKRLVNLQIAHWQRLVIAKEIWIPSQQEAEVIEQLTHKRLKHRGASLMGEWFDLDVEGAAREIAHTISEFQNRRT